MRCRAEKAAEELFCSRDCFLLKVHKFLLLRTKSGNKCSSITPTLGSYQSVCFTRIMRRCFAVPSPRANNKIAIERTPTVDITDIKIVDCRYYNISTTCTYITCYKYNIYSLNLQYILTVGSMLQICITDVIKIIDCMYL